jgi:3-hydroxybutyryl-CoA dehydrogenase
VGGSPAEGSAAEHAAQLVAGLAAELAALGLDVTTATPEALDGLGEVDLVVEAVADGAAAKPAVLAALDEVCRPGVILATTSSTVPVVECAAATSRPRDVVGLHLHASSVGGGLVEVVPAVGTADDVVATVVDLCRRLGRHPVTCGDRAGFVVEALLFPYLNDAVRMIEAGYADADAVDVAMTAGCGYPRGPIEVLDELGLDVVLAGQRRLYEESREPGLLPAPLLQQLVTADRLGVRTGRGVREHGVREHGGGEHDRGERG